MSRQCPLTKARAPFAAPVMARVGHCAICRALSTRRGLGRASPKGAPPNSLAAQDAASSPSPGASAAGGGAARRRRQTRSSSCRHTALGVSRAAWARSWRPRPRVAPTRTQFAARKLAPACSRSSTNVSSSQGRQPCWRSKSSPTRRTTRPSTCEARLRQRTPGRIRNRHNPTTRCSPARRRIVPADPGVASPQPPRRGREPHRPSQPCAEPTR